MEFILASGSVIGRSISEALIDTGHGESGGKNILGVVTLDIFGLIPGHLRELRAIRTLLKGSTRI